jgi:signal transduction histidine kinase/ActR/RegA family two-component response regulator
MRLRLQNLLLPPSILTGSQQDRRRSLLQYILLLVGACSLPFYGIHHPDYNHAANLIGTAGYWGLWLVLMMGAPYRWVANVTLLWSVLYVAYLAAHTGGINSPVMVWMTVALLPAVLLLAVRVATFWVVIAFLTNGTLLWGSRHGWFNSDINMANEVMAWTVTNKFFVAMLSMYVVYVTERMHSTQVAEIDQSNEELEKTQQALIQAQAHKDEFIASVSHELRTPMNAILGLNGILRNEVSERPEDVEVVDHIRRSTEQLLQVVNDILDFSQLQAGRLLLRDAPFYLHATLIELVNDYESRAKAKGLSLTLDAQAVHGAWVRGDRQRLVQVLKNLLDNALKFTAEGGVHLRVQNVSGGVLFEVEDTGIGVPADRQKQIFQGFEHADTQTKRLYGGTGLGLSICDRLIRLQGGHIGVSSEPKRGARFWFQLPLRNIARQDLTINPDWIKQIKERSLNILLVDDNLVNLLVARMMLKKCLPNCVVSEVTSGREALEKLQQESFDLVLMDMVMPDMDGMQVTQMLRNSFSSPKCDTPVLALTASANPVDHDCCLNAGMDDVIQKPLDEQQLMTKIANACMVRENSGVR